MPPAAGRSHWSLTRVILSLVEFNCCFGTVTAALVTIWLTGVPDESRRTTVVETTSVTKAPFITV